MLVGGVVYAGFGSHCDLDPWHGWLLGYKASDLSDQMFVYNTTLNIGQSSSTSRNDEGEGAIWASGTGPASDQSGDIYIGTGNGSFDETASPPTDVSDSLVRLGIRSGLFSMIDWFTPFNEASLDAADFDLGSGGPVILPDQSSSPQHLLVSAGKNGTTYLVDRDSMGEFNTRQRQRRSGVPQCWRC